MAQVSRRPTVNIESSPDSYVRVPPNSPHHTPSDQFPQRCRTCGRIFQNIANLEQHFFCYPPPLPSALPSALPSRLAPVQQ